MDSTARVRQVPLALAMLLTVPCVVVGAVLFAGQDQADAVDQIFKQAYFGRGKRGDQAYPAHQLPAGQATQNIPHNTGALQKLVGALPADKKSITVGYDSQSTDNQLVPGHDPDAWPALTAEMAKRFAG
jgi:hypothetical protein